MLGLAALMLVIAQHPDHRNFAGADVLQQDLHLARLAEIDQISAQAQDVGVVGHTLEQFAVRPLVGLAHMQVADRGHAQLLLRSGLKPWLGRLGIEWQVGHAVSPIESASPRSSREAPWAER